MDDEPAAGSMLSVLINRYLPVEKEILCCQQPKEALRIIGEFKPHLLMLDIEMPEMNGFDLLNQLGQWDFDVIFTTAYDKYAIKAIRFSAMDYLLKPIDIVDLTNALNRHIVSRQEQQPASTQLLHNLMDNIRSGETGEFKLALRTMEGAFFFLPSQILRLEGVNNYTRFFFKDRKPMLVSRTLREYEELLEPYQFVRVHKSHVVNRAYVKQAGRDGTLVMEDGSTVPLSRRKKDAVMQWFR